MGLLSSTVSLTRYKVEGKLDAPILEHITGGLKKYAVPAKDDDTSEKVVGWTSFGAPFKPNFENSSFVIGSHFIFSLRVDKKTIPAQIVKKYCAIEEDKQLVLNGRPYLSRHEKNMIKDLVTESLFKRIPAVPNAYDVLWDYEAFSLWFFSTLKSANEELETLFIQTFKIPIIRLFPYTQADLLIGLSDSERDTLNNLAPTNFSE